MNFQLLSALMAVFAAQAPVPQKPMVTFGTTVVSSSGFRDNIYFIKPSTIKLPKFEKLKPVGSIYTHVLQVPPRDFREGFPGVTDRFEWFAIDYNGRFWIQDPGQYNFYLMSDDGSKLYIDGKMVINNDGLHSRSPDRVIRFEFQRAPSLTLGLWLLGIKPGGR